MPVTDYRKEITEDSKIVGLKNVRTRDAVARKIEKDCNQKLNALEEEKEMQLRLQREVEEKFKLNKKLKIKKTQDFVDHRQAKVTKQLDKLVQQLSDIRKNDPNLLIFKQNLLNERAAQYQEGAVKA